MSDVYLTVTCSCRNSNPLANLEDTTKSDAEKLGNLFFTAEMATWRAVQGLCATISKLVVWNARQAWTEVNDRWTSAQQAVLKGERVLRSRPPRDARAKMLAVRENSATSEKSHQFAIAVPKQAGTVAPQWENAPTIATR